MHIARSTTLVCTLAVLGCAGQTFPPAVPETPGWANPVLRDAFAPAADQPTAWAATQIELAVRELSPTPLDYKALKKPHREGLRRGWGRREQGHPTPSSLSLTPASVPSMVAPGSPELHLGQGERLPVSLPPKKAERPMAPEQLVAKANAGCLMLPTRQMYQEGQVTYPWEPGRCYLVLTAPDHPTVVSLPPDERVADTLRVDKAKFDIKPVPMGAGTTRVEAFLITPTDPGFETTVPVLTQAGRTYFLRLRSLAKTGMLGVTWTLPEVPDDLEERLAHQEPDEAPGLPPLDDRRLHQGYSIEAKGGATFVPVAVLDDGRLTQIRFARSLAFGRAPGVFSLRANGQPGVV